MENAANSECGLTPKRRNKLSSLCASLRRENTILRRRLNEVTGKVVHAKPGPQMQEAIDHSNAVLGTNFGLVELCSQLRFSAYVKFRQHTAYRLRTVYGWSYPRIGNAFGGRDHATIMHAIAKHIELAGNSAQNHDYPNADKRAQAKIDAEPVGASM